MNYSRSPTSEDPRRHRVLDGALKVFLSYGYKRVTMDDIAQAAEMSRPALYLLFRNKADIYRAIGQRMFELSAAAIDGVMAGKGTLAERLDGALTGVIFQMMCQITASPHGAELLDLKNELAAGMLEDWRDAVSSIFARAFEGEAARSGINMVDRGLSSERLSNMLLDGMEGMKQRVRDESELKAGARQLVKVIELALRP